MQTPHREDPSLPAGESNPGPPRREATALPTASPKGFQTAPHPFRAIALSLFTVKGNRLLMFFRSKSGDFPLKDESFRHCLSDGEHFGDS
ncbi:hypothetical protein SRHO_G00164880 [Serrasalmus rhombeus]